MRWGNDSELERCSPATEAESSNLRTIGVTRWVQWQWSLMNRRLMPSHIKHSHYRSKFSRRRIFHYQWATPSRTAFNRMSNASYTSRSLKSDRVRRLKKTERTEKVNTSDTPRLGGASSPILAVKNWNFWASPPSCVPLQKSGEVVHGGASRSSVILFDILFLCPWALGQIWSILFFGAIIRWISPFPRFKIHDDELDKNGLAA